MELNTQLLIDKLATQYEVQLRTSVNIDFTKEISKKLLLEYSLQDKHAFLKNEFERIQKEIQRLNKKNNLTTNEFLNSRKNWIIESLPAVIKSKQNLLLPFEEETVFQNFVSCSDFFITTFDQLENTLNKLDPLSIGEIKIHSEKVAEQIAPYLVELKKTVLSWDGFLINERQIEFDFEYLMDIQNQMELYLSNRASEKFNSLPDIKGLRITESKTELVIKKEARKIVFDNFIHELNSIKQRSLSKLQHIEQQREYELLNELIPDKTIDKRCFKLLYEREFIETQLSNILNHQFGKKIQRKNPVYGVKWIGKPNQLLKLYQLLIDKNIIISNNATKDDFVNFFNHSFTKGKSFVWQEDLNLISYLFEELCSKTLVASKDCEYNATINKSSFLIQPNGYVISGLKQARNNYLNNKKGVPTKHIIIDKIISHIQ